MNEFLLFESATAILHSQVGFMLIGDIIIIFKLKDPIIN